MINLFETKKQLCGVLAITTMCKRSNDNFNTYVWVLISIDATRSVNMPASFLAVVFNCPGVLWQFGGNHIVAFNRHTVLEWTHSSYFVKCVVDASHFFLRMHCD